MRQDWSGCVQIVVAYVEKKSQQPINGFCNRRFDSFLSQKWIVMRDRIGRTVTEQIIEKTPDRDFFGHVYRQPNRCDQHFKIRPIPLSIRFRIILNPCVNIRI